MKSDAFGTAPANPPPAATPAPSTPNASPPAASVNQAPAPAPANPPPAPAPSTAQTPPAPAPAPQTGMPKVGTVTAANPTGDPSLNNDGTPKVGDNSAALDEKKAKLHQTVKTLGQTRGAGANSLGELAVLLCQATRDGIVSVAKGSTDVGDIYTAFYKAQSDAQIDDAHLEKERANSQSNINASIAKLNIFAKLGAVDTKHDTARLLAMAREVIPEVKGAKVSTYNALRIVAKAQLVAFKADPKSKPLTKAQIKTMLAPTEKADEDLSDNELELREVEAIVKRMLKLQDGTDDVGPRPSDELQRAISVMSSLKARLATAVAKEQGADEGAETVGKAA